MIIEVRILRIWAAVINTIRRISIFKRLLLSFMIVILIPSVLISYFSFKRVSKEIVVNEVKYSYHFLNNMNSNIRERLKSYNDLSYKLYVNEDINEWLHECKVAALLQIQRSEDKEQYNLCKKKIELKLYDAANSLKFVDSIEILTSQDEFTEHNSYGSEYGGRVHDRHSFMKTNMYQEAIGSFGDSFWYNQPEETPLFLNQPAPGFLSNTFIQMRSIPDKDTGKALGVIIININLNVFEDLDNNDELKNFGNLLLVGQDGKAVASLNTTVNGPFYSKEFVPEIQEKSKGDFVKSVNGIETLVTFLRSNDTGWHLVSLISRNELLKSVYQIRSTIIQITIAFVCIALVISYLVMSSIYFPMKNLKSVMGKVGWSDLNIKYLDPIQDEIGLLGRIFNHMIIRIRDLVELVYKVELEKKQEEIRRKEAELNELLMQMNPHFLYNTLDIIRWQALFQENGEGEVSKMIATFSTLLRNTLIRTHHLIPFEEEIMHIKSYHMVLAFRFQGLLEVNFEIAEEIRLCKVIKFILQPLVENSIVHGAVPNEKIRIRIKAYRRDELVFIEVLDNGKGIGAEKCSQINHDLRLGILETKSIGIKNINKRIKLRFGEQYGIQLSSNTGTHVTVMLPFMDDAKEMHDIV